MFSLTIDLVVEGLKGDVEGAHMELQLLEKVAARRLKIVEDLAAKSKEDVVQQLVHEECKAMAELKITKKKLKSVRQEKNRNLVYKRKRVAELVACRGGEGVETKLRDRGEEET
jgi:ABC-type phosphate transport system auxiliary subunit